MLVDCIVGHLMMDPRNGSGPALASPIELEARIEALFDEGYPANKAACLQNEIQSAMQLGLDRDEGLPTVQQQV